MFRGYDKYDLGMSTCFASTRVLALCTRTHSGLAGHDESHVLDVRPAQLLHGKQERREEKAGECERAAAEREML